MHTLRLVLYFSTLFSYPLVNLCISCKSSVASCSFPHWLQNPILRGEDNRSFYLRSMTDSPLLSPLFLCDLIVTARYFIVNTTIEIKSSLSLKRTSFECMHMCFIRHPLLHSKLLIAYAYLFFTFKQSYNDASWAERERKKIKTLLSLQLVKMERSEKIALAHRDM